MLEIFAITVPIFILIGLGYAAVRVSFFSKADTRVLGAFVINFALPTMLFKALSQRTFGEVMNLGYLGAYALGSIVAAGGGFLLARGLQKRGVQGSIVVGMGTSMSNSAFIGLPVALQVVGPVASVAMALTMLVENLLMLPLLFALADGSDSKGAGWRGILGGTLVRLAKNPMVIAILLGFAFALYELRLPQPVFKAVDMLSSAAAPIALFVIGGNLVGMGVRGMIADVSGITLGKLIIHPLAVLAAVLVMPGIDPTLQAAAVLFACVPMMSIYAIVGQKYGLEELCAATLVTTTIASFASISLVIWAMKASGFVPGLA